MTASDVEVVTLHVGDDFEAAVCGGRCLDFSDDRRKSVPLSSPPFGAAPYPPCCWSLSNNITHKLRNRHMNRSLHSFIHILPLTVSAWRNVNFSNASLVALFAADIRSASFEHLSHNRRDWSQCASTHVTHKLITSKSHNRNRYVAHTRSCTSDYET
eukprot:COSAG02_NODE_2171_length_9598_cov_30.756817_10_plen_157_part_00